MSGERGESLAGDRLAPLRERHERPLPSRVSMTDYMAARADIAALFGEIERLARAGAGASEPREVADTEDRIEAMVRRLQELLNEEPEKDECDGWSHADCERLLTQALRGAASGEMGASHE